MPGGSLETLAADTGFPALAEAASAEFVTAAIAAAPGLRSAAVGGIEVLNHKPGRRCTICYALEGSDAPAQVIGKWYREAGFAAALYSRLVALAEPPASLFLPRPLLYHRDGLVLQEHVAGADLRELVAAEDTRPFAAAGTWLARLHALAPIAGLKLKARAHELAKVEGWRREIEAAAPAWRPDLDRLSAALPALATSVAEAPAMIHRDYYPANLRWDGERVWGLDFDQMALGDPALDVASFLAQLEKLAIRDALPPALHEPKAHAFLDAYGPPASAEYAARLAFFTAYTFLKLAAAEVQRLRPGWHDLAGRFIARAGDAAAVRGG